MAPIISHEIVIPSSLTSASRSEISPEICKDEASSSGDPSEPKFGSKTIGFLAGCALLVNNITGPGVPGLPNVFAEAGWLMPTVCILVVWVVTTLSASMYCEAMRCIPGNEHFQGRAEYTVVVEHYFGPRWVLASRFGLNGALQSLNVISVVLSAQVVDNAISAAFGKSCALNWTPFENVFSGVVLPGSTDFLSCIDTNDMDSGNAWGCHIVLSLGFVIAAAMALPCGRWNLDDNMTIQTVAFVLTIGCWIVWIAASATSMGDMEGTPLRVVNTDPQTGSNAAVLGTILFNFGFVTTVPSWVNEKRPGVSVNKTLWVSTTICILVFFAVGITGAAAFSDVLQGPVSGTCPQSIASDGYNCANTLMQVFTTPAMMPPAWRDNPALSVLLQSSVYLFPVVAVVSSIPVFSIVIKYNLIEAGWTRSKATGIGVVLPWVVAFPLVQMPNVLAQLVNFTSLLFVTFTDFIVPLLLFVELHKRGAETDLRSMEDGGSSQDADYVHDVFGRYAGMFKIKRETKITIGYILVAILTVSSFVAAGYSVAQGTYTFDSQTCALVGN